MRRERETGKAFSFETISYNKMGGERGQMHSQAYKHEDREMEIEGMNEETGKRERKRVDRGKCFDKGLNGNKSKENLITWKLFLSLPSLRRCYCCMYLTSKMFLSPSSLCNVSFLSHFLLQFMAEKQGEGKYFIFTFMILHPFPFPFHSKDFPTKMLKLSWTSFSGSVNKMIKNLNRGRDVSPFLTLKVRNGSCRRRGEVERGLMAIEK